jgi:hypothetical protein
MKKTVVAATILACLVGWMIHVAWQRAIASQLESYGASVTFERTVPIGVRFDCDVSTFSNEQMPMVGRLTHLRWLDLVATHVTDEGLNHVGRLSKLERLTVRVNQISVERERRLNRRIGVTKIRIIDGMRVVDGFE